MATDKELVEQIRHGDREVYSTLFRKYYLQIYAICLSMLNNPQEAEELTQEMFVHAYFKLDQLRDPEKFYPWLKKITLNRSKNYLQRSGAKEITLDLVNSATFVEAPDEYLIRQELTNEIMEAIENLPTVDRKVIQARIDGLNHAEISKRFDMSVQASMSRLSRIRKKLFVYVKHLLYALFKLPSLKKVISGGVMTVKAGTTIKIVISVIGIIAIGFIGIQMSTRQNDTVVEETQANNSEQTNVKTKFIKQPTQKVTPKAIKTQKETINTKISDVKLSYISKAVPTAKSNDDEIRNFSAWVSSWSKEDTFSKSLEVDNTQQRTLDVDQEKTQVQSVIFDQWKKGYETRDVERYMSSIWEDGFFYISDMGTPDLSDDVIFRGGQRERESAIKVFKNYPKKIELNITPQSDVEFLSDRNAMVKYNYELKASKVPTPDSPFETFYGSGNMIIVLARREVSRGKSEWRILEWYDYSTPSK